MAYDLEPREPVPEPDSGSSDAPWTISDILKGIGVVILGIIVVSVVAAIAGAVVADSIDDIEDDPVALTVVLAFSIPLEIAFFGVAWLFAVRKYNLSLASLGFRTPERRSYSLTAGMLGGSLAIIWVYFGVLALFGIEPEADLPEEVFENPGPIIAVAVLSLGFAPVMEETFFRGFVFGGLRRPWGLVLAALGSGLLFGVAHLGNPGTFYVVPPISLVGALFAWGYHYSGSLYPSIGAHFLFNLFSFSVGLATS